MLIKKLDIKNEELGCSTGSKWFGTGKLISSISPVDGKTIGKIKTGSKEDYETIINTAKEAFIKFRKIPIRYDNTINIMNTLKTAKISNKFNFKVIKHV